MASKKSSEDSIQEQYTKYEIARMVGSRALQLSMGAPALIKLTKEELEKIRYNPIKIAEKEFEAGVLPVTVKRPIPGQKN
jgi:DNA-directed RNA polymerase subunit K